MLINDSFIIVYKVGSCFRLWVVSSLLRSVFLKINATYDITVGFPKSDHNKSNIANALHEIHLSQSGYHHEILPNAIMYIRSS